MTELLKVENLSKTFTGSPSKLLGRVFNIAAVKDVSFSMQRGEILGVVGESGCGKSTLARCILRLIEPTSGRVAFLGQQLNGMPARELRRLRPKIQMIFQDPYSSLNPRQTIGKLLSEPLQVHRKMSAREAMLEVTQVLEKVGLPADAIGKYPHAFSGGQRQRISIARALVLQPDLIIADEAVSALDVSVQAQILALLESLKAEYGLSFLFITHDLGVVRNFCDRVLVMYLGSAVEEGSVADVLDAPQHPYTQSLIASVPLPDPTKKTRADLIVGEIPSPSNAPPGCPFHPRCDRATDICNQVMPAPMQAANHSVACHHPLG